MAQDKAGSEARQQRLARALKANIARRKAQARRRQEASAESDAEAKPETPPGEDGCPN